MIETERLRLRQWRDADRAPFAAMNADRDVMAYFPEPYTRARSDSFVDSQMAHIEAHGWGWFAIETRETGAFCGFAGLSRPGFQAPFMPAVEIGWRLARPFWGKGYATEGARATIALAFDDLGMESLVSFTTVENRRSRAVMERLGMRRDPSEDFDHPRIPVGHPLARHVLYRLSEKDWRP
ncbi:GNAT family N-acetyltransferase [Bauldia sp.]|uniref:GNAT family N-acetyltransferase n=1 Tax=Bauldia sp. TaxID=2575872 RepID=UPI003BA8497D